MQRYIYTKKIIIAKLIYEALSIPVICMINGISWIGIGNQDFPMLK